MLCLRIVPLLQSDSLPRLHAWIYKEFEARSCESQVEIDSMITCSDSNRHAMWCNSNSRNIFPVGCCAQNNIQLTPPPGMQFFNTAHLISMFVFCN